VPLSEHEQRQLEQIEQALYAEHPRFARAVRKTDPRVHYRRRALQAALGFLLGLGLLLAGVITTFLWIAVAGFVVMLGCAVFALSSYRHLAGIAARLRGPRPAPARPRPAGLPRRAPRPAGPRFMDRLEERWRRRQERGGW
jgi:hypothetical protein